MIQASAQAAGFNVEIQQAQPIDYANAGYDAAAREGLDMSIGVSFANAPSPVESMQFSVVAGSPYNYTNYSNPEITELLDTAWQTDDQVEAAEALVRIEEIYMDQYLSENLLQLDEVAFVNNDLQRCDDVVPVPQQRVGGPHRRRPVGAGPDRNPRQNPMATATLTARRVRRPVTRFARRLIAPLGTILAATTLVYLALAAAPGDPVVAILGPRATPEQYAYLRAELGLDHPLPVRFWNWLTSAVTGDFGNSLTYRGQSAWSLIEPRLGITLWLVALRGDPVRGPGVGLGLLGGAFRRFGPRWRR